MMDTYKIHWLFFSIKANTEISISSVLTVPRFLARLHTFKVNYGKQMTKSAVICSVNA